MKVKKLGSGEPEYSIVGSLHGDEPCGKKAIERFLSEDWDVNEPVQFIIANEEALEQDVRFIDDDLNRSFPGDPESDSHEEMLADELKDEIEDTKVLDIHSTHSTPVPFATLSEVDEGVASLMASAGISRGVYFPRDAGSINEQVEGVTVEVGRQGMEEAVEMAYEILINFLAAEGVIDAEYEKSEQEFFEYYGTVENGDAEFKARNFELVEKGETFARKSSEAIIAEEDFYPVLMSTNGYDSILGFKAKKMDNPLS